MYINCIRFHYTKKFYLPKVIEFCNDHEVTVCNPGLFKMLQNNTANAHDSSLFQLSLVSINRIHTAGYTSTSATGQWFISTPPISAQCIVVTGSLWVCLRVARMQSQSTEVPQLTEPIQWPVTVPAACMGVLASSLGG
jgi:hypothetical protein